MVTFPSRRYAAFALTFALSAPAAYAANAYQVQPMSYVLAPSGQHAQQRLTVTNTDAVPLDAEVDVYSVVTDVDGKRTFTPADDQFLIFPVQATIQPGAAQSFQVRYIGDPAITHGQVYAVQIKQLNINYITQEVAPGKTSRVAIAMNFNTTAVVQPPKAEDSVSIVSNLSADAQNRYIATVANSGNGVADLSSLRWQIRRNGKLEDLSPTKLKYGETSTLAPGQQRRVSVDSATGSGAELQLSSAH